MPPEQNIQPSVPPTNLQPDKGVTTAKGRPSKRVIFIVGAIVLVLVAVVLWLLTSHFGQQPNTTTAPLNGPALSFQANPTAVKYGGADVVQACNLLPQAELAKANYKIDSGNGTDIFSRTYFNSQGTTGIKLGQLGFKVIGGPYFNSCSYLLAAELRITTTVVQTSYIQNGSFSSYVAAQNPTSLPDIDGVKILKFADPDQGTPDYALTAPNSQVATQFSVESTMRGQDPSVLSNAGQAILQIVAKNLASQSTKATGPPELTYDHRAFPATYAKACQLTNNDDFKKIYSVDQAPLVTENGGNPGTTTINGTSATFIDNQCLIESYINIDDAVLNPSADFSIADTQYLTVRTETYLTNQAAEAGFSGAKQAAKSPTTASGIGDEAFFATQGGGLENPLILRKGRFIVELAPTQFGVPSTQSATQITSELTPLGKKVAGEL